MWSRNSEDNIKNFRINRKWGYLELTHWKRPWCWEGLGAGGEGDDRGWNGWMASPTRCTWVWVNSGNWWWTGRLGVLQFMGLQRVGHHWAIELSWTELRVLFMKIWAETLSWHALSRPVHNSRTLAVMTDLFPLQKMQIWKKFSSNVGRFRYCLYDMI